MTPGFFLVHAQAVGATKLIFVVNVQEAFGRCLPVDGTPESACKKFTSPDFNGDNVDPLDSTKHFNTLSEILDNFAAKASDEAFYVQNQLKYHHPGYVPEIYWEIGNEVNLIEKSPEDDDAKYQIPVDQYNSALSKYKTKIHDNPDPSPLVHKIAAVGSPTNIDGWWNKITSSNYDVASVHGNYGMHSIMNYTGSGSQAKTQEDLVPFINRLAKPVMITEWNSAIDTNINNHDTMLHSAAQLGVFSEVKRVITTPSNFIGAYTWPTVRADQDHWSLFSNTYPYAATEKQRMQVYLNPALSGTFQKYQLSSTGTTRVVEWQAQIGGDRKIVIVNAENTAVRVPITIATNGAPTVYAKGIDFQGTDLSCNFTYSASNMAHIVVGPSSFQVLHIWH